MLFKIVRLVWLIARAQRVRRCHADDSPQKGQSAGVAGDPGRDAGRAPQAPDS